MSVVITLSSDDEENINHTRNNSLKKIKNESNHKKPRPEDVLDESNLAIYKKFLEFCTEIEVIKRGGSPRSMKQIKEKLLSRFNDTDPEYTKSEAFKNSVSAATRMVEKDPSNLFVYMKQVVDELKVRNVKKVKASKRKISESEGENTSKRVKEDESSKVETPTNKTVNERHVKKLELIFQKVYRKVKKLEEKEVDWNDDEDSAYIRLERYKKRLYLIWEKWQEVRGHKGEIKRLKTKKVAFSGTNFPKLNQAIESYVNRNQNFPDFFDILKLTTDTLCPEGEKAVPQEQLQKIATAAFQSLGNQLQKRRVFEFWNSCLSYLPVASTDDTELGDPADKDKSLAKILEENHRQNQKKMNEVINKFVEQQVTEKLEPQEVLSGMEDGDSKSEEEEEEEEPEEEPEDMIMLSSSSEESDAEVEESGVGENGINTANHCENGNLEEVKSEDVHKNGDENEVHEEKMDSLEEKDKKSSSGLLSVVKSEPKPTTAESVATSSSVDKNEVEKVKSGDKMNDDADCDIVLLSGSDTEK